MNPLQWTKAEVLHFAWKRGWYTPPDRKFLVDGILTTMAADATAEDILFVGVQWYTAKYPMLLSQKRLATIDMKPEHAQFGAGDHTVGDVCELPTLYGSRTFNAIIMNGVIGYGLDTCASVDRALKSCASALRSGGLLIMGVNEESPKHIEPSKVPSSELFEPGTFGPWFGRVVLDVPFREHTHTFLFWRKR